MTVKEEKSIKSVVEQTTQDQTNSRIKVKICCTMLLYSKEEWIKDYRKLNQVTIKNKTPLSLIGEVINKLKEAKYFNKLDLIWGYNNVQIKEEDE